jgi:hypothetical protein
VDGYLVDGLSAVWTPSGHAGELGGVRASRGGGQVSQGGGQASRGGDRDGRHQVEKFWLGTGRAQPECRLSELEEMGATAAPPPSRE